MVQEVYKETEEKMEKTIAAFQNELTAIRAGRANPQLLDRMTVDYYGVQTPINQVATISTPEPRLLVIQPWDASLIPAIEKTLLGSDLGITPSNDGKLIRLPFPQLTEYRRKELVKVVGAASEKAKVAIRNSRRDAMDTVKKQEKASEITEDEKIQAEQEIQKITDTYIEKIVDIVKVKESELMDI